MFVISCFDSQKELYSGSSDRQILVWAPPKHVPMDDLVSILAVNVSAYLRLKMYELCLSMYVKMVTINNFLWFIVDLSKSQKLMVC
jgi:hypothetical protein